MQSDLEVKKQFIPPEWQEKFEFVELMEKKKEWSLILREKEGFVPEELRGEEVVLNGFMNPIEIVDFPFRGKLMYIQFIRRRWKIKGKNRSYFNSYELHPAHMKATKEFGAFLKELTREERAELFRAWEGIRLIREEDI